MENNLQSLLAQLQSWGQQSGGGVKWNAYMPSASNSPSAQGDDTQQDHPQGAWAKLGMLLAPNTTSAISSGGLGGLFGGGSGKGGATTQKAAPPSYEPDHSGDF